MFPAHLCRLSPSYLLPVRRVFVPGHQIIPPELRYKTIITQILELCYNFKKSVAGDHNEDDLYQGKVIARTGERV